jgi:hypothetical protein
LTKAKPHVIIRYNQKQEEKEMTIERVNENRVQLKTLRCGDVFVDERGSVLMRTEDIHDGDEEYNAVNLEDGLLYYYDEIIYVDKKPTAILKI